MAQTGNHGIKVPRDKELLTKLYWECGLSLVAIGKIYDVNFCSVRNVFRKLGIPTLGQGGRFHRRVCKDCGVNPPMIIPHKLTKTGTGTRCEKCHLKYKAAWIARKIARDEEFRKQRREEMRRWYEIGPMNPKGEDQWIRKAKHLLRTNKRILKTVSPAASASAKKEFAPAGTSQT